MRKTLAAAALILTAAAAQPQIELEYGFPEDPADLNVVDRAAVRFEACLAMDIVYVTLSQVDAAGTVDVYFGKYTEDSIDWEHAYTWEVGYDDLRSYVPQEALVDIYASGSGLQFTVVKEYYQHHVEGMVTPILLYNLESGEFTEDFVD